MWSQMLLISCVAVRAPAIATMSHSASKQREHFITWKPRRSTHTFTGIEWQEVSHKLVCTEKGHKPLSRYRTSRSHKSFFLNWHIYESKLYSRKPERDHKFVRYIYDLNRTNEIIPANLRSVLSREPLPTVATKENKPPDFLGEKKRWPMSSNKVLFGPVCSPDVILCCYNLFCTLSLPTPSLHSRGKDVCRGQKKGAIQRDFHLCNTLTITNNLSILLFFINQTVSFFLHRSWAPLTHAKKTFYNKFKFNFWTVLKQKNYSIYNIHYM